MPPLGISNVAAAPPTKALAWSRLRGPLASVGTGVCPYADTFGPATPNGVRGYIGPPASALQLPTNWLVRASGSNNNGGTSATVDRSGSDAVTNGTTTITSATAAFTSADVGKGICINTGANARRHRIVSVTNATTIIVDRVSSNASSLAWVIGGAWADTRPIGGDAAVSADTNSPVRSGDSVYVGAGTYRQVVTQGATWTAAFNGVVNIVGDVTGQYTGDAGMVQLTAYTTNDKTAPSVPTLLNLNGKSNLAFSNIMFVGGNAAAAITASTVTSQNVTFRDCAFLVYLSAAGSQILSVTAGYNVPLNWTFDRCFFHGFTGNGLAFTLNTGGGTSDYGITSLIQNCVFSGPTAGVSIDVRSGGASAKFGGGITIRNNLISVGGISVGGNVSTVFPCLVSGCVITTGGTTAISANGLGQVLESYNLLAAAVPRANVNVGAGSISNGSYAPLLHFGQERIWGGLLRPFGEPMAGSPLLGFGNDGGQTPYDLYNRPRPAGGGALPYPAVGALERSNTPTQASSPAPPTGTYDWQFTGPGFQELLLPVNNTSTTVSIKVQRDSAYSPPPGGTLPAIQILANGRLGIPAQTIVDTGSAGGWNTLSAQAFTPSGTGWVTVRICSYDGTGVSVCSFANLTVT